MDDNEDDATFDLFEEPKDYYPPPKQPTEAHYRTVAGQDLALRLVGSSPLWVSRPHLDLTAQLLFRM